MKQLFGHRVYVDSVGVRAREVNAFSVAVLDEIGIDISRHPSKSFDDLADTSYDLIISLSPEAQHKAVELTRTMACEVEYWPTLDPTVIEGNRETVLAAFRDVRDRLHQHLIDRFSQGPAPTV